MYRVAIGSNSPSSLRNLLQLMLNFLFNITFKKIIPRKLQQLNSKNFTNLQDNPHNPADGRDMNHYCNVAQSCDDLHAHTHIHHAKIRVIKLIGFICTLQRLHYGFDSR